MYNLFHAVMCMLLTSRERERLQLAKNERNLCSKLWYGLKNQCPFFLVEGPTQERHTPGEDELLCSLVSCVTMLWHLATLSSTMHPHDKYFKWWDQQLFCVVPSVCYIHINYVKVHTRKHTSL